MPNFTANIAFLFPELPFLDRIAAAKTAGFDKVECHYPYEFSIEVLRERLERAEVQLTGLNTEQGDPARGERGRAAVPGLEAQFRRDFDQALAYATALGASVIHVMAGVASPEERAAARKTYVSNLRAAARSAASVGVTLLLEPLNSRDAHGYLVSRSDDLAEIIAEIGEPNVKLLFDVYHVQIMEGDLIRRIERHRGIIGHVQVAGVPSRAEPDDDNEVNFSAVFRALEAIGYQGLVGLEYRPRGDTVDGLGWMDRMGVRP
ncbi:MAG: Hydroxypyruvate isomerase [uncultured Microvirga sp.]|uniref:Hydroxypyruvate isomerase n=1 Tax=uncultured Microvirga sp. TaxID=412392 RepID=A0A6J4MQL3_9HYPH|nr:MAG: Hydroxypyruvate isomerase [uncultured Microvirga sp.]